MGLCDDDRRSRQPSAAVQGAAVDGACRGEMINHPKVRRLAYHPNNGNVLATVENIERADRHLGIRHVWGTSRRGTCRGA
jgi:hypothetical protein